MNPSKRRSEASKLMEGCVLVGASGLILATAKTQWAQTTIEALVEERQGRLHAGKAVPTVSLLTGLGTSPKLSPLAGT
jgi:hypothetical protein